MSNIFEALRKGRRDIAEVIPPLTEVPKAAATPMPRFVERLAVPARTEEEPAVPEAPPPQWSMAAVRTLPLRVSETQPLFPFDGSCREASEQYRIARARISHNAKRPKVLVISSAAASDGKSVTAINMAGALSLRSTTLLVDADFRRSRMALNLGIAEEPGLANVLDGGAEPAEAIVRIEQYPNLYVIAAGKSRFNPTELLESQRWPDFVKEARKVFEYVVIDSPPAGKVADYDLLAAAADGVIVVVRPDVTPRHPCYETLEKVPKEKMIGVLVNGVRPWLFGPKHDGYDYY